MPNITIQLDQSSVLLLAQLKASMDQQAFFAAVFKLFDQLSAKAAGWVVKMQLSGQALHRRTGALAGSIVGRAEMRAGVPAFRVGVLRGPALRYAGVMERGTQGLEADSPFKTIRPVNAKALAMPVDGALTPAGVARWQGPRQYPGRLSFVPYRSGGKAIGGLYDTDSLKAARGDLRAANRLYVLLKQLDLPAHHYLLNGMRTFIPYIVPELTVYLRSLLAGAKPTA